MLTEVAELEHQLLCSYLFLVYSLKGAGEPGMTDEQAAVVAGWRQQISVVASQEMLHLTLANNILSAVGSAPHFLRPNLPQAMSRYYPPGYVLELKPFSLEQLDWAISYESANEQDRCPGAAVPQPASAGMRGTSGLTIGELYEQIALLLVILSDTLGEQTLFIGDPAKQTTTAAVSAVFGTADLAGQQVPLLTPVFDLNSALIAINTIVVQGEGASSDWLVFREKIAPALQFPAIETLSHEKVFCAIRGQYAAMSVAAPEFAPVRPVVPNPYPAGGVAPDAGAGVTVFDEPLAVNLSRLFDRLYGLMLRMLARAFAPGDESSFGTSELMQQAIRLMVYIIGGVGGVGDRLAQVPAFADGRPGNAGPSFTWDSTDVLIPQQNAAWIGFSEEMSTLRLLALEIAAMPDAEKISPGIAAMMASIARLLEFLGWRTSVVHDAEIRGASRPELHACYGLNACAGHGVAASGTGAGDGLCSTADPHICSGNNSCRGQGGCGYIPRGAPRDPAWQANFENHPNENVCRGFGACSTPIMPGTTNTAGRDTDDPVYGDPAIYDRAKGSVWEFARILLEQRMKEVGIPVKPAPQVPGGEA
jgi:hypothetical protein